MNELPVGWAECVMGDIAKVVGGGTPKADDPDNFADDGQPWITPADLSGFTSMYIHRGRRSLSEQGLRSSSAVSMPKGTVLFTSRAPIGYVAIAAGEIATNQGFRSFVTEDGIIPEYVFFYLKTIKPLAEQMANGTTFLEISGTNAGKLPIVIPPTNEQRRIVAKLEQVLARVEACRARLEQVPTLLKRFRQSVLAAACSGRLTEDWRERIDAHEWKTVPLPEVATSRLGKMLDKAKNTGTLQPYLRNVNVRWFDFNLTDIQEIRVSEREIQELAVIGGDVLVCEGGEPGRCAVWRGSDGMYTYQKALHRVRVGAALTPDWLCYCLKDAVDSGRLYDLFTGTTIKHLTGAALARFELPLPPPNEQHEIVRRVTALFVLADQVEARYLEAKAQVDRLTQAILAKAFRGELVPQDPADEPAAALLARIQAKRGTGTPTRTARRGRDAS